MEEPWKEISPVEMDRRLNAGDRPLLVDVRTPPEVAAYHIPGIHWIPLNELAARHQELDPEQEIVLICEHGVRSTIACQYLHQQGYRKLGNLSGGMSCWDGPIERGLPIQ
ncbi:MAG: rhodanese-like domain-containing protein [Armatimonadetes bacterium]|nr:rhodanese-like domain-containing protein [Armatimonadota bacterium]